ncbi:DUF3040 domain-containing protein [Nonomuraea candida]|uniref:DUF3040 domain-containing protein n=1 Tax=Nonomuraea candida TaxID=359159 RepID=UPI0005BC2858|nr:DUF3040 domain-containing protein [Nonomuraea candida]
MEGLSPQERLILAAIEMELRDSGARLADRLEDFNARAAQEGPQRFAAPVSRWEVAAVLAMVLLVSAILTLVILTCRG